MAEFVQSKRGKTKLIVDNYVYQKERTNPDGDVMFWRCEKRGICKSRIHTEIGTDRILRRITPHSHAPDCAHVSVLKAVEGLKDRAVNTQETTGQSESHPSSQTIAAKRQSYLYFISVKASIAMFAMSMG